jgi:hypothetical protein
MREPEEIKKDLEAIRAAMKKRSPNSGRASAQKKLDELSKKDIELEKELVESLEQKYKMKKTSVYL